VRYGQSQTHSQEEKACKSRKIQEFGTHVDCSEDHGKIQKPSQEEALAETETEDLGDAYE
jgi:hypothetical protein